MRQQIKSFIESYYYFFDKKLKNTTVIVGLIGILILIVGILFGSENDSELLSKNLKTNVLENKSDYAGKKIFTSQGNIIEIGGIEYNVMVSELEK